MIFSNSKKNLTSLLLLGSLLSAFSQVEGKNQFLRRRTNELCTPFENRRDEQDLFTFILLEFEQDNLNSQYVPNVSGDQFVETYNSLVTCDQVGAIRAIANADEFKDGTDLAAPRAVYFDLENQGGPTTVLIELSNFFCNSCGQENFSLFYTNSTLSGKKYGKKYGNDDCDCRGPTVEKFISVFF